MADFEKTYERKGFWVFYRNGLVYKTQVFKGGGGRVSLVQLYPNGGVSWLRISRRGKTYSEFYDKSGKQVVTEKEYESLEKIQ